MTGSAHLEVILYFTCVIAEIFSLLYSERSTFLPNPRFRKTSFLSLSYFDFTRTVLKPRFWPSLNKVQGPGAGAVQGESLSPSLSGDERPHRTHVRPALTLSFSSSSLQLDRQLVFCPLGGLVLSGGNSFAPARAFGDTLGKEAADTCAVTISLHALAALLAPQPRPLQVWW